MRIIPVSSSEGVDVSVILPCFRSGSTIGASLDSLLRQNLDLRAEILVVDSSDDDTHRMIQERFPEIRLIRSPTRLTPGAARNRGVEESRAALLAFLDADAVAHSEWLATLLDRLGADQGIRMVGAAVANGNPSSTASRVQYWIEFSEFHPGHVSGYRPFIPSCNFMIRRSEFDEAGGFDPTADMSEDMLFCRALGSGIYLECATRIEHRQREDWREVLEHLERLGFWSGRLRARQSLEGSRLRNWPLLTPLLVPFRLARILKRARSALGVERPGSPWRLARGLWSWQRGFSSGIRGSFLTSDPHRSQK